MLPVFGRNIKKELNFVWIMLRDEKDVETKACIELRLKSIESFSLTCDCRSQLASSLTASATASS